MVHRIGIALGGAALLLSLLASAVAAGGPPGLTFYVDDARYRTIGTPTDLSLTGAPDSSYDKIYALGGDLINVAEAKPGDRDYNGGRWLVFEINWIGAPVQFTNDADILQAELDGYLTISSDPVQSFVCPVIKVPPSWN
jgi:hypothetical protein